jgi:hypothetical protein
MVGAPERREGVTRASCQDTRVSSGDSEVEDPGKTDEEHTYTIVVGEVPEPGTPGTEELSVVQRPHKPHPRLFRSDLIELGSGHFGADQWFLMYDRVGSDPPDEDHLPSGPEVMLYVGSHGGGGPIGGPLSGLLGRSGLLVLDLDSPAYASGKVAFGFDRVQLDCAKGPPSTP